MITKYFRAFRFAEVSLLTGFVLIGAVFSITAITSEVLIDLLLIFCIAFCAISSLYAFNAYQGRAEDQGNERLKALREIPSSHYLLFFIAFFILALIIGFYVQANLLYVILLLGVFGIAYSIPGLGKDRPFAGTVIHLLFQITAFHIGFIVFQPPSISSLLISIYFSLLYMAGHFHHEVIDFEADKKANLNTGAVYLGVGKTKLLSIGLFSVGAFLWATLYISNIIESYELLPFLLAYFIHLIIYLKVYTTFEQSHTKRLDYRSAYRLLYLIAGIILCVYKFYILN